MPRPRRPLAAPLLVGVAVALVLLSGLLVLAGLQARAELDTAQRELQSATQAVQAGRPEQAVAHVHTAGRACSRADRLTHGPVWALAARVPVLGREIEAVRHLTAALDVLTHEVVPPGVQLLVQARSRPLLRPGRLDLTQLPALREGLVPLRRPAEQAVELLTLAAPPRVPPLANTVDRVRLRVDELNRSLRAADTALTLLPSMLGEHGPRRILVAVQNPSEARATGGLVGAFAVLVAERGQLRVERLGTDGELVDAPRPVVNLPGASAAWLAAGGTRSWTSAPLEPDYPSVSRVLAALWQRQSGQRVDATVALDPLVLRELLRATGEVQVGRQRLDADSVVDFIERDQYALYPGEVDSAGNRQRKLVLAGLAGAVLDRVLSSSDQGPLLAALAAAATSGHLFVGSEHPAEAALLSDSAVGGRAAPTGAYLAVLTQNASANKVDAWVRREVSWQRLPGGAAQVTVRLSNLVPASPPPLVALRLDTPLPRPPGSELVDVTLLGGPGGRWRDLRVDGRAEPATLEEVGGQPRVGARVELLPGRPLVVSAVLEGGAGRLTYRQQPRYAPDVLHLPRGSVVQGR